MDHLTATTVIKLMRKNRKSIHDLATAMNVTKKRVREVRTQGVAGEVFVQDWMQAITGDHKSGWAAVAQAYV